MEGARRGGRGEAGDRRADTWVRPYDRLPTQWPVLALSFVFRRAVARGLGGLLRLRGSLGSGGGFRCVRFARGRWLRGSGFGGRLHCRMNGSFCRAFCGRRGCGGSGLVCGAGCGGGRGSLGSVLSERALGGRLDGLGGFFALLLDFGLLFEVELDAGEIAKNAFVILRAVDAAVELESKEILEDLVELGAAGNAEQLELRSGERGAHGLPLSEIGFDAREDFRLAGVGEEKNDGLGSNFFQSVVGHAGV